VGEATVPGRARAGFQERTLLNPVPDESLRTSCRHIATKRIFAARAPALTMRELLAAKAGRLMSI
jgi:hypothetical protein